ncbi:MAG: SGNH/GDSL hydrolase family protein [Opitutaceae bacterium]|nr:SGNH/GDSL hydrolase family protein [Opitutaceae bacterium]
MKTQLLDLILRLRRQFNSLSPRGLNRPSHRCRLPPAGMMLAALCPAAALCSIAAEQAAAGASAVAVSPQDPRIKYSGCVRLEFVSPSDGAPASAARFDRILDIPGKGYRWDNPGARIRFRTDAAVLEALLHYSELHISTTGRNGTGLYTIDGISKPEWRFQTGTRQIRREPGRVTVVLADGEPRGFREYELILPYGDSVDFLGLRVNPEARFEPPAPKPSVRCLAYGDSVTHGFSASDISKTYPFLLGARKNWEIVNLGLGGRASNPGDGKIFARLEPALITILMGVNDWQGGVPPERYRANMRGLLANARAGLPQVPIYLITPLWVAPSWLPHAPPLDGYRQVLRDLVAELRDPDLHLIEGPELIDHDPRYFDPAAAVHPNDEGFAMMAGRLARLLKDVAPPLGGTPPVQGIAPIY